MTHRKLWYNVGRDRRRIFSRQRGPRLVRADFSDPSAAAGITRMPGDYGAPSTEEPVFYRNRPYAISDPPFTTDALGQPFPAGTVWVMPSNAFGSSMPWWNLRPQGNSANPLTESTTPFDAIAQQCMVYTAYGIPAGASGVVSAVGGPSGVTLFTVTIPSGAPSFLYELPPFTQSLSDTVAIITSTWTGGTPIQEGLNPGPQYFESDAIAVPSTLPASYTPNLDSTNMRGVPAGFGSCGDPRRIRAGPNATYETMGLGSGSAFGFGPITSNVWIGGNLYRNGWPPIATGQLTLSCGAGYLAHVGPVSSGTLTTPGLRYAQLTFGYTKLTADPGATDTVSWTLKQDGVTIATGSATGAAIESIPMAVVAVSLPAAGVSTTFTLTVSGSDSSAFPPPAWELGVVFSGSPRCDIPLPFSAVGPGNIGAPGGYLPGALQTPANSQPLTRLAAGVTSTVLTSPGNVAFLPATDGWYAVTANGTRQPNIGEDEFGWQDFRNLRRGHIGRPFYARCDSPGASTTLALVATAAPTPVAIASGGTNITLNQAGTVQGGAWCSIALPSAGAWRVNVSVGTFGIYECGIVADLSMTDPTVFAPEQSKTWEPYIEVKAGVGFGGSFQGIGSTPPGSPTDYDAWVVGASPSGAWMGHEDDVAIWDPYVGQWQFSTPVNGSVIPFASAYWYDGAHWHSNGIDPQLSFLVRVTGAQTVYLLVQPFDGVADAAAGAGAVVSWAAA